MRKDPIYHSTYTGRPPDEPAVLGVALNEVFVPILQKQFPEIEDFYLPPEGCSYRMAVVTMKKQYPGHAKRVMMGVWSFLRQFMYTKFVVVCDESVNARDWGEVVGAMTRHMDPAKDTLMIESTPIDSLDFASPVAGLGSKMGLDATKKWDAEIQLAGTKPSKSPLLNLEEYAQAIQQRHPEIKQLHFPAGAIAGQMAIVNIDKQQPGQGEQIMHSIWSYLSEQSDLKFIIVCDDDVDVTDWNDVIWAITTRMDPSRDTVMLKATQQQSSRIGLDATNKLPEEITREWGTPIKKDPELVAKIDDLWSKLGID